MGTDGEWWGDALIDGHDGRELRVASWAVGAGGGFLEIPARKIVRVRVHDYQSHTLPLEAAVCLSTFRED